MLKFANTVLEILLEFGMHYPSQSTSVACLFDVKMYFYEFKLLNMIFLISFVWLYTIYSILYVVYYI
jgi:hypothetical protein